MKWSGRVNHTNEFRYGHPKVLEKTRLRRGENFIAMKLSLERGRLFSEITLLLGLLAYVVVYHGLVMNYMQMRALEKFKAVTDTNGDHVLSTEELVTSLGNMMGASAYKDGEFLYVGLVFIFDMNKDNAYDEVELSALLDALDSFNEATDLMRSIGGDHLWKPSFTLLAFATVALLALFVDLAMSALRYEKSVETLECELAETRVHHDELHDAFEEYEVSKKREASSKESRKTALKKLHSARASVSLLNVGKQGSREVVVDPQPGDLLRTSLVKSTAASASASDGNVTAAWRAKLHQAAGRMREPSYDLKSFHLDMVECFPELLLYLADSADASSALGALEKEELVGLSRHLVQHGTPPHGMALGTSLVGGARTGLEEYNRTIGALFAVYWLSRLELPAVKGSAGLDGQRGFCFGVDAASWRPLEPEKAEEAEKRRKFLDTQDWAKLHQLMLDAGVLQQEGADAAVDVPRMAAMLTLTAIHDIMKNTALLPTVAAKHAPYMGHEAGVVIADHDEALGYVLTHDADSLPCYAALPESQRAPIRFTQADMGFNNGHLVQASPHPSSPSLTPPHPPLPLSPPLTLLSPSHPPLTLLSTSSQPRLTLPHPPLAAPLAAPCRPRRRPVPSSRNSRRCSRPATPPPPTSPSTSCTG